MSSSQLRKAIEQWQSRIGAAHVLTGGEDLLLYQSDVSGLSRNVPAVLFPGSTEEVQQVVEIANSHKIPLYPISRGRNWGMGSRLPARDDTVVVALERLNEIFEVNVAQHYAVVGPGVTQGQLYDYLEEHDLPLVMNVTGSTRATSLVGNALERGVGYFAAKADSLSGLEVVLGNAEIIRTGCGHFTGAVTTHINRHGLGPFLDGLFSQSNYGIVTRAGIDLMPRRQAHASMVCSIDSENKLGELIDRLAELRRQDIIQSAVHIANRERSRISVCPLLYNFLIQRGYAEEQARKLAEEWFAAGGFGAWSAVGGLMGSRAGLRETRRRIRKAMKGLGRVFFLTDGLVAAAKRAAALLPFIPFVRRNQALLFAAEPFYELSKGVPTDAALSSVYWPVTGETAGENAEPDQGRCGLMYCLPMIPMSGTDAMAVSDLANEILGRHGMTSYVTLNIASTRALECVINVAFDREDESASARARQSVAELHDECFKRGYIPYRLGIQMMDHVLDENDTFWQTVRDLKKVLDPNNIIAPGRYNLN